MMEKTLDSNAAMVWLSEHGDYLFRYALMRLRDEEQARDAVQETLLAAWRANAGFRGDSSIRTWLVGILKHKITDQIRKQIRDRRLNEDMEADPTSSFFNPTGGWASPPGEWQGNPEQLARNSQFRKTLMMCISRLPDMQKEVFSLRELAGEDSQTICKACNITTTNLHVIMHRARMALRACLEQHWFNGERSS